jgi:hypothetical protein
VGIRSNLLECLGHNFRSVVDGQNNIGNTSSSQTLNLVENHGSVAELDEWLWEGEGLCSMVSMAVRGVVIGE